MYQAQRVRTSFVLAALLVSPILATRAHAATIDLQSAASQALCDGMASCGLSDGALSLTLTAVSTGASPKLDYKTVGGQPGLGVSAASNDRTPGEIDPNESIDGALNGAWVLDSFKLLFIYNGPEYDDPYEIAKVSITKDPSGTVVDYFFTVNAENSGNWTGGGTVTNCGFTDNSGSGCFLFSGKPFGNTAITGFSFTSITNSNGKNDSDYSLGSLAFSSAEIDETGDPAVPEPGSMLLLGSGLLAMGRAVRRRRLK